MKWSFYKGFCVCATINVTPTQRYIFPFIHFFIYVCHYFFLHNEPYICDNYSTIKLLPILSLMMPGYLNFKFYVTPTQNMKIDNKSINWLHLLPKIVPNMFVRCKNDFKIKKSNLMHVNMRKIINVTPTRQ